MAHQTCFSFRELKEFIETTLDENAIAIGPGIFYVFRDKNLEQQFQQSRQKRHYEWRHLTAPEPVSETQARLLFTQHQPLFEAFWKCCLDLGRLPAEDEFTDYKQLNEIVGSPKKALRLVGKWYNQDELEQAAAMRKEDLLVYFALAQFQKHKGYAQQPEGLKRDIKALFGNYNVALTQAKELLFSIADPQAIEDACLQLQQLIPGKAGAEYRADSLAGQFIHLHIRRPWRLGEHQQRVQPGATRVQVAFARRQVQAQLRQVGLQAPQPRDEPARQQAARAAQHERRVGAVLAQLGTHAAQALEGLAAGIA